MSDSGQLAFEPGFVKAQAGDTIVFDPTQKGGHSTYSLLVPPGAEAWFGAADNRATLFGSSAAIFPGYPAPVVRVAEGGEIQVPSIKR